MTEQYFDREAWTERIRAHRSEKDEFLAMDPDSPIPESEREGFDGLDYFPLDGSFRVEGRYEARENPETVKLGATKGPDLEFEHVGNVGVSWDGDLHVLAVYQAPGVDDGLLPFRDGTNGTETWEHGRYLAVDLPEGAGTGMTVDFNLAYHPFCVYDDTFVSAIPPKENELPVPIRSGERL